MRLSTILLIFLLLFVIYSANAQITIMEITGSGVTGPMKGASRTLTSGTLGAFSYNNLIDTIKSELIVTALHGSYGEVRVIYGYEVIKRNMPQIYPECTIEWFYLDDKKKPLSKYLNVWMSKPVKK